MTFRPVVFYVIAEYSDHYKNRRLKHKTISSDHKESEEKSNLELSEFIFNEFFFHRIEHILEEYPDFQFHPIFLAIKEFKDDYIVFKWGGNVDFHVSAGKLSFFFHVLRCQVNSVFASFCDFIEPKFFVEEYNPEFLLSTTIKI